MSPVPTLMPPPTPAPPVPPVPPAPPMAWFWVIVVLLTVTDEPADDVDAAADAGAAPPLPRVPPAPP